MHAKGEQSLLIKGPAGKLEAKLSSGFPPDTTKAVGIVCHPHPLHGGSMDNKVVYTIVKAFNNQGVPCIRFNFRGVGKSEGSFDETIGETDDAISVIEFAKKLYPGKEIWLGGFSFGAYISLKVSQRTELSQLITIAPAVNLYNLNEFIPPPCPWLLAQGEDDEIVPLSAVQDWLDDVSPKPSLQFLPDTGHFFHKKLVDLRQIIEDHLTQSQ